VTKKDTEKHRNYSEMYTIIENEFANLKIENNNNSKVSYKNT